MNREERWRQQVRPTYGFYTEQRVTDKRKLFKRLQPLRGGKKVYLHEWNQDLQKIVGRWVYTRSEEEKKDTQD